MNAGESIDRELDELNEKLYLLMEYLGVEFVYDFDDVVGIKKKEEG